MMHGVDELTAYRDARDGRDGPSMLVSYGRRQARRGVRRGGAGPVPARRRHGRADVEFASPTCCATTASTAGGSSTTTPSAAARPARRDGPGVTAEIGIGLQGDKPPGAYAALARDAEANGIDVVSVFADLMFQPPLPALLEIAAATSRVRLGRGVLQPVHPAPGRDRRAGRRHRRGVARAGLPRRGPGNVAGGDRRRPAAPADRPAARPPPWWPRCCGATEEASTARCSGSPRARCCATRSSGPRCRC